MGQQFDVLAEAHRLAARSPLADRQFRAKLN
jgi:hypothetical protein